MKYVTISWASSANKNKLDEIQMHCDPFLVHWKWRRGLTWSPWNSEEPSKFLPRCTRSGDNRVICSTTSSTYQTSVEKTDSLRHLTRDLKKAEGDILDLQIRDGSFLLHKRLVLQAAVSLEVPEPGGPDRWPWLWSCLRKKHRLIGHI